MATTDVLAWTNETEDGLGLLPVQARHSQNPKVAKLIEEHVLS